MKAAIWPLKTIRTASVAGVEFNNHRAREQGGSIGPRHFQAFGATGPDEGRNQGESFQARVHVAVGLNRNAVQLLGVDLPIRSAQFRPDIADFAADLVARPLGPPALTFLKPGGQSLFLPIVPSG